MQREAIAMILAGGSGNRLKPLTNKLAKPAVLFGGKYRIIDFVLSNCVNSGIDVMGLLVQYEFQTIGSYVLGSAWSSGRQDTTITMLPPCIHGGGFYKGTANSVYQNLEFIDLYHPEYVIILSADQVYKMDYTALLDYHKSKNADVTVAVTEVPPQEAHRFGIAVTDSDFRINKFYEKPNIPRGNLASLGIYVFNTNVLKVCLGMDEDDPDSANDFGRNIIPSLIKSQTTRVYAYPFAGYWRDVGTVKSFWEAHMDLLEEDNGLNLHDESWMIHCHIPPHPPLYINQTARLNMSLIGDGCFIKGEVDKSVLFSGVHIGRNSKIYNSVIMSNVKIEDNTIIRNAIIGSNAIIKSWCEIGEYNRPSGEITYIDEKKVIEDYTKLYETA